MSISQLNSYICFLLFLLSITIGNVFYHLIGFSFIDEILILILFAYTFLIKLKTKFKKSDKEFLFFILIALFYLAYSIALSVNVLPAIFSDFQQQIKPFLAFYCILLLKPEFTEKQRKIIRIVCIFCFLFLLFALLNGAMKTWFFHVTIFASAVLIIGVSYYYFSDRKKIDLLIMILMLSIGLFSTRAKFYGEFACILAIVFFLNTQIKLDFKTVISFIFILVLTLYVSWYQIDNYFIAGASIEARPILYKNAFNVLNDYFPFGSGYGTYGNDASRVYYSPLYHKYDMSSVWGLSEEMDDFIADTFFPVLCQFGYIGILLFVLFWKRVYRRLVVKIKLDQDIVSYKTGLILLSIIFIESIADTTFISNRGVSIMLLLGMVISMSNKVKKEDRNGEMLYR